MTIAFAQALTSRSDEALALARELVNASELGIASTDQLLRRARRLFSLIADSESLRIVDGELSGYPDGTPVFQARMNAATLAGKPAIAFAPLALIELDKKAAESDLLYLRVLPSRTPGQIARLQTLPTLVGAETMVDHVVRVWLNREIVRTYHELRFGDAAQTIFEAHRARVDALLNDAAADAITSLKSVNMRVLEGDAEAMSQALNSCRRLIYALADKLVTPTNTPAVVDGKSYDLGADKYLNRIYEHMRRHGASKSRRDHIDSMLKTLHSRLSAGLKTGVSADEGRSLVLTTYLVLGEVLLEAPPIT